VCDREKFILAKTLKQLQDHGFVAAPPDGKKNHPAPPTTEAEDLTSSSPITVNTYIIDRTMVSKLYAVNARVQPRLVSLLFFWEEECQRWAALDAEEREILGIMRQQEHEGDPDLLLALEAVQLKKRLLPSQRADRTTTAATRPPPVEMPGNKVDVDAELPGYDQAQSRRYA
jgi:hypothetical protein